MLRKDEQLKSCGVRDGSSVQVTSRMRSGGKHKDKNSKAEKKQAASAKTPEQKFAVRAHVSCCVVQAEARGARVVRRNDECARIAARCAWCVCLRARCARHVDIHIRGHLAQNVVRLLLLLFPPTRLER